MSHYKEYGYADAAHTQAHSYLLPALLDMLKECHASCILDVGCGNGSLSAELIRNGYDLYGIDASVEGITQANNRHAGRFFVQDFENHAIPEVIAHQHFDTLISIEVIEHLYDPRGFLQFCKTFKRNGHPLELIISTPYHGYMKNLMIALSGKFDAHFTALWDGGHIKFWSYNTLSKLLHEQGFRVQQFRGAGRLPGLWKSMMVRATLGE